MAWEGRSGGVGGVSTMAWEGERGDLWAPDPEQGAVGLRVLQTAV